MIEEYLKEVANFADLSTDVQIQDTAGALRALANSLAANAISSGEFNELVQDILDIERVAKLANQVDDQVELQKTINRIQQVVGAIARSI